MHYQFSTYVPPNSEVKLGKFEALCASMDEKNNNYEYVFFERLYSGTTQKKV